MVCVELSQKESMPTVRLASLYPYELGICSYIPAAESTSLETVWFSRPLEFR